MNRREMLAAMLALGGATAPFRVRAQQARRVAFFVARGSTASFVDAFRAGLREQGIAEGRDIAMEVRSTRESRNATEAMAREIVASRPDIIVAAGGAAVTPLYRARTELPVVFALSGDPVEAGLVRSFGRPGTNFTGITWLSLDLVGKRLELLKEALPRLRRLAVLANPLHHGEQQERRASEKAAAALGLEIRYYPAGNPGEFERAFEAIRGERCEGLDVYPDGLTLAERARIAAFATGAGLAAVSGWQEFASAGFLASYGPNRVDTIRYLATYVSRILRGAIPADLPVELPKTVEMVVNLSTARTLDVALPRSILLRADRVIE